MRDTRAHTVFAKRKVLSLPHRIPDNTHTPPPPLADLHAPTSTMAVASDDVDGALRQLVNVLACPDSPTYSKHCLATFSSTHYRISAPLFARKIQSLADLKLARHMTQRTQEMFQALLDHEADSPLLKNASRFALAVLRNALQSTGDPRKDWVRAQTCFNFCSCIHIYTHGEDSSPLDAVWRTIGDAKVAGGGATKNHTVRYPSWRVLLLRVAVERSVITNDWTATERALKGNGDLLREAKTQVHMMEADGLVSGNVVKIAREFLYRDSKRPPAVGVYCSTPKRDNNNNNTNSTNDKGSVEINNALDERMDTEDATTDTKYDLVCNEVLHKDDEESLITLSPADMRYLLGENEVDMFLDVIDEVLSEEPFHDEGWAMGEEQSREKQSTIDSFFKAHRPYNAPPVNKEADSTPKKRKARVLSPPTPKTARKTSRTHSRVEAVGEESINITDIASLRLVVKPKAGRPSIRMRHVKTIQPEIVLGAQDATTSAPLFITENFLLCLESIHDL